MSLCGTQARLCLQCNIRLLLGQSVCRLQSRLGKLDDWPGGVWGLRCGVVRPTAACAPTLVVRCSMKVALDRLLSMMACLLASAAASLACKDHKRPVRPEKGGLRRILPLDQLLQTRVEVDMYLKSASLLCLAMSAHTDLCGGMTLSSCHDPSQHLLHQTPTVFTQEHLFGGCGTVIVYADVCTGPAFRCILRSR